MSVCVVLYITFKGWINTTGFLASLSWPDLRVPDRRNAHTTSTQGAAPFSDRLPVGSDFVKASSKNLEYQPVMTWLCST